MHLQLLSSRRWLGASDFRRYVLSSSFRRGYVPIRYVLSGNFIVWFFAQQRERDKEREGDRKKSRKTERTNERTTRWLNARPDNIDRNKVVCISFFAAFLPLIRGLIRSRVPRLSQIDSITRNLFLPFVSINGSCMRLLILLSTLVSTGLATVVPRWPFLHCNRVNCKHTCLRHSIC